MIYMLIGTIIGAVIFTIGIFIQVLGVFSETIGPYTTMGLEGVPIIFPVGIISVVCILAWPVIVLVLVFLPICYIIGPMIDAYKIERKDG